MPPLPTQTPPVAIRRDSHANAPGDPPLPATQNRRVQGAYLPNTLPVPAKAQIVVKKTTKNIYRNGTTGTGTNGATTGTGGTTQGGALSQNNNTVSPQATTSQPLSTDKGGTGINAADFRALLTALSLPNPGCATYKAGDANYSATKRDQVVQFKLIATERTLILPDWTTMWTVDTTDAARGFGLKMSIVKEDTTMTPLNVLPLNGTIGFNGIGYNPSPSAGAPKIQMIQPGCIVLQFIDGGCYIETFMANES